MIRYEENLLFNFEATLVQRFRFEVIASTLESIYLYLI